MSLTLQKLAHAIYIDFSAVKKGIFNIVCQNSDCGYTIELPLRGSSNEYPQSMFWIKNEKNWYTPEYLSFVI